MLDAAGTLIRPREPVARTYAAAARHYGVEIDRDSLALAFADVFHNMPMLAFEWTSRAELSRLEREWWRHLVHRVVASTGNSIGNFQDFFDTLYEHYAGGSAWEHFPEIPGVLKDLRARGCRLAVVSNFDSRLPGILDALGIGGLLDAVVYSSEAGCAKPNPAIFQRALAALGVAPERAIHVGDSVEADLKGAASVDMRAVLVQRKQSESRVGTNVIRSLDLLPALIDGFRK